MSSSGILPLGDPCSACSKRIEGRKPGSKLCGPCNYTRKRDKAKLARCGHRVPLKKRDRLRLSAARIAVAASK